MSGTVSDTTRGCGPNVSRIGVSRRAGRAPLRTRLHRHRQQEERAGEGAKEHRVLRLQHLGQALEHLGPGLPRITREGEHLAFREAAGLVEGYPDRIRRAQHEAGEPAVGQCRQGERPRHADQ